MKIRSFKTFPERLILNEDETRVRLLFRALVMPQIICFAAKKKWNTKRHKETSDWRLGCLLDVKAMSRLNESPFAWLWLLRHTMKVQKWGLKPKKWSIFVWIEKRRKYRKFPDSRYWHSVWNHFLRVLSEIEFNFSLNMIFIGRWKTLNTYLKAAVLQKSHCSYEKCCPSVASPSRSHPMVSEWKCKAWLLIVFLYIVFHYNCLLFIFAFRVFCVSFL